VGNTRAWGIVEPVTQPIPHGFGLAHIHNRESPKCIPHGQPINRELVVALIRDCLSIEAIGLELKCDCLLPHFSQAWDFLPIKQGY